MKRSIFCYLCVVLLGGAIFTGLSPEAQGAKAPVFSDISQHWAKTTIESMVEQGILDGFPDGTFRSNEPVTVDQFIKMLILSYSDQHSNQGRSWRQSFLDSLSVENQSILKQDYRYFDFKPAQTGYWARPYVDVASDLHFLNKNRYEDFQANMTRENVAEVLFYVLQETEFLEDEAFSHSVAQAYGDLTSASERQQKFMSEALVKGIMEGYPNGKFGVGQYVTRAESLVILNRLTDKTKRISVKPVVGSLQRYVPTIGGGQKVVVFPDQRMWNAYDMMLEAGKLRGTNFDMLDTTLRLYKDTAERTAVLQSKAKEEVALWLDPTYNTYGITVQLREGTLARNKEPIEMFCNEIFGNNAIAFHRWFDAVCVEVEAGRPLASKQIKLGTDTINVLINNEDKTVSFSIAATM
ncbi:S-layer homology domain-containing protein [Paenibacillus segetis]|uniref:SLH domain-containing protein n=1 Tax=Paenibacillus segetis TaxID=1325360 RepID=A0ABQ1YLU4_9BACL|nr:S-layer homology domain-containing protein [Paenibacillus segetis]GGH29380.1 hypothetical protein GCM10008013_31950 [Paenibacillus segetis]